jgi:hypothetical protein
MYGVEAWLEIANGGGDGANGFLANLRVGVLGR